MRNNRIASPPEKSYTGSYKDWFTQSQHRKKMFP